METLRTFLEDNINETFIGATLSNPREKSGATKIKVRPVLVKGNMCYQLESYVGKQAFHENIPEEKICEHLAELMENMKQMQVECTDAFHTVLVSKKGKVSISSRKNRQEKEKASLTHNRVKRYILKEGRPIPFLIDLGVMNRDGMIVKARFDKFRQINRFLEFIEDILPALDKDRELTILDFGCGKSYLTFAMYYYLHELKGYDISVIGLDLKSDVIKNCNQLAEKYGYDKLAFLEGDIADYTGQEQVDMVVTLHACDTATDYALAKAVGWNAKVILSVPCCQHEVNFQLAKAKQSQAAGVLDPVLKYGLLRERMAALLTDGLRAEYLEREGYQVQVLEFIDMEHTPKNILIRAVRTGKPGAPSEESQKTAKKDEILACQEFLQIRPTLGELLHGKEKE